MGVNKILKVKFKHKRIFSHKLKNCQKHIAKMYAYKRPICCYQPRNLYRNELDFFPLFDDYQPRPFKMVRYNPRSDLFSEMINMMQMPVISTMPTMKKPKIEKPENVKVKVDSKNNTIEVSYENKTDDRISYYKEVKSLPKYISKNNSFNKIKSQIINGKIKIILPEKNEKGEKTLDSEPEKLKEIEQKSNKEKEQLISESELQKQKSTTNDVILVETEEEEHVKSDTEMKNSDCILERVE